MPTRTRASPRLVPPLLGTVLLLFILFAVLVTATDASQSPPPPHDHDNSTTATTDSSTAVQINSTSTESVPTNSEASTTLVDSATASPTEPPPASSPSSEPSAATTTQSTTVPPTSIDSDASSSPTPSSSSPPSSASSSPLPLSSASSEPVSAPSFPLSPSPSSTPAPEFLSFNEWREKYVAAAVAAQGVEGHGGGGRRGKKSKATVKSSSVLEGEGGNEGGTEGDGVVETAGGDAMGGVGAGGADKGINPDASQRDTSELDSTTPPTGQQPPNQQEQHQIILSPPLPASPKSLSPIQPLQNVGTSLPTDPLLSLKDRSNYAAFDCSAKIHRSSPSSKSSSSILIEKKDRYMLTPCSVSSKFVELELCDEIMIDTIVLANFELFSSMFKLFEVKCSVDYPGNRESWFDLGTFRARNARGLQVFQPTTVPSFCRYVRISFLSQYGSEYYCPVSLLRVYGHTQLDAWRESERKAKLEELALLKAVEEDEDDEDELEDEMDGERMLEEQLGLDREWEERGGNGRRNGTVEESDGGKETMVEKQETESERITTTTSSTTGSQPVETTTDASPSSSSTGKDAAETTTTHPLDIPTSSSSTQVHSPSVLESTPIESIEASPTPSPSSAPPPTETVTTSTPVGSSSVDSTVETTAIASSSTSVVSTSIKVDNSSQAATTTASVESSSSSSSSATSSTLTTTSVRSFSDTLSTTATTTSVDNSSYPTSLPTVNDTLPLSIPSSPSPSSPSPSPSPSSTTTLSLRPTPTASPSPPPLQNNTTRPLPLPVPPSQPQPGESIYGTIMKRLASLEHNQTLSMHYIELQSGVVRDALGRVGERVEEGEITRNKQELMFRQVLVDLEKQRNELERERIALVSQVNLLAQEVRHERRLSLAQLIGLVVLVVFVGVTRGSPTAPFVHFVGGSSSSGASMGRSSKSGRRSRSDGSGKTSSTMMNGKRRNEMGDVSGSDVPTRSSSHLVPPSTTSTTSRSHSLTLDTLPYRRLSTLPSPLPPLPSSSSSRHQSLAPFRRNYHPSGSSSTPNRGGERHVPRGWTPPPLRHASLPPGSAGAAGEGDLFAPRERRGSGKGVKGLAIDTMGWRSGGGSGKKSGGGASGGERNGGWTDTEASAAEAEIDDENGGGGLRVPNRRSGGGGYESTSGAEEADDDESEFEGVEKLRRAVRGGLIKDGERGGQEEGRRGLEPIGSRLPSPPPEEEGPRGGAGAGGGKADGGVEG